MQTSPQGVAFSVINISHPSPNDILMGRGGGTNLHPGNLNYRRIIDSFKPDYSASPKAGKFKYACEVVDMIRNMSPPGRFLKKDANTNLYFDVGEKAAREKTSQVRAEGVEGEASAEVEASAPRPQERPSSLLLCSHIHAC